MSNNLVFNSVASKLLVLINGVDPSGNTKPIKVDNNGVLLLPTVTITAQDLDIRNLSGATDSITIANDFVTITAQDLDIRNLSGATDSILVANNVITVTAQDLDIRNLSGATDSITVANDFVTITAQDLDIRNLSAVTDSVATIGLLTASHIVVQSSSASGAILMQDTGLSNEFSYYVLNNDATSITVRVEISPTTNSLYFLPDPNQIETVLGHDGKAVLISSLYTRYTRLFYQATATPTNFEVYYTSRT